MTIKNLRGGLVGLSATATLLSAMTATAQAQTTTAQPPILASFALTNSNGATFNGASITSVAPTTIAASLQSALLSVPAAGPGTPPAPGLTKSRIDTDGFDNVFEAFPSNQTITVGTTVFDGTTQAGAIVVGSYFTINLTANAGTLFNVGTLQFDVGKGGLSDPRGYDIRSSVDNYSSSIDAKQLPTSTAAAPTTDSIFLAANPLYQNLTNLTFRFYVYTPNPPGASVDFRNILISSAGAPEPGDLALLLIGIAPMAIVLRRRKKMQA